jgi:hypothetical protein
VRPSTILEFHVSTSLPWLPGISLLLGPKYSSYHPCRLIGQIDWHALDIGLGISPFCLQIHFCINSLNRAFNGRYLKKVFSKCLARSLSAL